nr:Dihydrofolate reductase [uncultured bacterium]
MPWRLPGELAHFKKLTSQNDSGKRNAVIMGRKTWQSLPAKSRPLKDRLNIVVTSDKKYEVPEGVHTASSLDEALAIAQKETTEHCFVIGGAQLYEQAMQHPGLRNLYITEIEHDFDCDCFFPEYASALHDVSSPSCDVHAEKGFKYRFKVFERQGARANK